MTPLTEIQLAAKDRVDERITDLRLEMLSQTDPLVQHLLRLRDRQNALTRRALDVSEAVDRLARLLT